MPLMLTTDAFANDGAIPRRFTCDGENLSPPLAWNGAPDRTESLALLADDPDAPGGVFTHWLLYNVPASVQHLPAGVRAGTPSVANGGAQGKNDFGQVGYGGPCPPKGHGAHRYRFTLYAVDTTPPLQPGATKRQVLNALQGHVLEQAQLVGVYQRAS